jgi:pimeloyl-ACP methyl ester carboxylesterase
VRRIELSDIEGARWLPQVASGTGALVLAGSSGRVDEPRAELLARHGVVAESIRWFGGSEQHDGPWEIPIETFLDRVDDLARECDRVIVVGTSFGAEAALITAAVSPDVTAVVAFAPSDVVWAGIRRDGTMTSHWTLGGTVIPYVPFIEGWEPQGDVPAYLDLYLQSRERFADCVPAAEIAVERIDQVVLVAGGDDQVWPSCLMAESIARRRRQHGQETVVVVDPVAGHRTVLPGEAVIIAGTRMQRGGTEAADRRLGLSAWAHISTLL